jgi:uncharacterized membrane protein
MKQDNITEMHIYVKYKIVSFMRRQFSSLKVYIKIVQNRKKKQKKNKKQKTKNKTKVGICTLCVILMMAYAIHSNVRNLGLFFIYDKVFQNGKERNISLVLISIPSLVENFNPSNTTGATCGAGTSYPSGIS